jgi:methionyl-tRNA formyltransferase
VIAENSGIPVLQPDKPRGEEFMADLSELAPDVSAVAAYGHILRAEILDLPALGSFNVHASLLPELRGAAPVNWAIIRGFSETGVTIMRMVEQMDAGPMILKAHCPVPPHITAGVLTTQLAQLGAAALIEALALIEAGAAEGEPQDEAAASFAPKLAAEDARIDWSLAAVEIDRWIRGTDPAPGAWSELGGLRVRLFAPRLVEATDSAEPGVVALADPRAGLEVATGRGRLGIGEVQPAGKRRMGATDWIRGRGIEVGQKFI